MPNPIEVPFLIKCKAAAQAAGHPFPGAAAAEAWNETGGIHFPPNSNNVLGIKAGRNYKGKTVTAFGTEQNADGSFTGPQHDLWRAYASLEECFADQLHILHTQKDTVGPNGGKLTYAKALAALTPEQYIAAECPVWSTNQSKAHDVLVTYQAHIDVLG